MPNEEQIRYWNEQAPGPFAFAELEYVRGLLEQAGFVSITSEAIDLDLDLPAGRGLDAAVEFVVATGLVARAIEHANLRELGPITASLRNALSAHARNQNVRLSFVELDLHGALPERLKPR